MGSSEQVVLDSKALDTVPLLQTVLWRLDVLFSRLENNRDDPIFEAQIQAVLVIFDDSRLEAEDAKVAIAGLQSLYERYGSAREGRINYFVQQSIKFLSKRTEKPVTEPAPPSTS